MLKVRVIPTLLWKDVGLVKGIRFASDRRVGPMVPAVRVYAGRDVDELILVDVAASDRGAGPDLQLCAEAADEAPVPLTFGGGITSAAHVGALLAAGADKVSINTCAVESPSLITEAAHLFGSQCIVVSIDALAGPDGRYGVVTRSGSSATQLQAEEWARECEERGAGEILLTAVHRDGTREGYDLQLIRSVADSVTIPLIASGGAGSYEHMREAVRAGADAVAAASIFHYTELTPAGAKDHLARSGIPVRKGRNET